MRKIFTLLLILVVLPFFALQAQSFDPASKVGTKQMVKNHKKMVNMSTKGMGWFIPAWDLLDDFYMGSMDGAVSHYANVMWPDSTVKYMSSGENYTWLHSFGMVIDPYADWYPNGIPDDGTVTSIQMDSVFVLGWYENVDGVFSDTLVFEIVVGTPTQQPAFDSVYNTNTGAAFSAPKMMGSTTLMGWHAELTDPNKYVIKHVLTPNDSTLNFGKFMQINITDYISAGISINPGEVVGVSATFVPGYSYTFGDTIFSYDAAEPTAYMNTMRFGFYGTDDANANPDLFLDPYNDAFHYNGTYMIMTDGRYGLYGGILDEIMYPYTDWGLDMGAFFQWTAGVDEQQAINMSIYPNPVAEQVNISVEDYNNTTLEIYNLLGEVVKSTKLNSHNTQINVSDLNNGTYIVRIMNGQKVATKKVIINK